MTSLVPSRLLFRGDLPSTQPGEQLWLICQAKVPLVMRPGTDGNFALLGEALVHGAMYGELLRNGVAGEAQDITIV